MLYRKPPVWAVFVWGVGVFMSAKYYIKDNSRQLGCQLLSIIVNFATMIVWVIRKKNFLLQRRIKLIKLIRCIRAYP